jgi:hypothetical protein
MGPIASYKIRDTTIGGLHKYMNLSIAQKMKKEKKLSQMY